MGSSQYVMYCPKLRHYHHLKLYIFENDIFFLLSCLQFQFHWALQPTGQQFLTIPNEEIHFPGRDSLSNNASYPNEVVLTFDDDFRAKQIMPCPCQESSDKHIL